MSAKYYITKTKRIKIVFLIKLLIRSFPFSHQICGAKKFLLKLIVNRVQEIVLLSLEKFQTKCEGVHGRKHIFTACCLNFYIDYVLLLPGNWIFPEHVYKCIYFLHTFLSFAAVLSLRQFSFLNSTRGCSEFPEIRIRYWKYSHYKHTYSS